ncbi:MAG: glutathione S-transferase [Beijerinckiaceae bacterium]|nr:glutathione S-transferase [Beijerinckiaceae bacterium]
MIVVHHLNFSRSHRVLWLMEELGLDYELVRYERDGNFRAPPELAEIHPLGKSPVIVDDGFVLGESAVILAYLNQRHGGGRFAPPEGSNAYFTHEEWLHYAEGTAALPIMALRIGALTGGVSDGFNTFLTPTLKKTLNHIGSAVGERGFLSGEAFMLADLQMAYLLEVADHGGMLGGHPLVQDYLGRLKARPAFQRAVAIGGPMMPQKRSRDAALDSGAARSD